MDWMIFRFVIVERETKTIVGCCLNVNFQHKPKVKTPTPMQHLLDLYDEVGLQAMLVYFVDGQFQYISSQAKSFPAYLPLSDKI